MNQLQSVYNSFRGEMIVGDDEGHASIFRDVLDPLSPGFEFFLGIQIVVALRSRRRRIVAEPRVVAPPVQAHITDGSGNAFTWPNRSPDHGLINVAEPHPALVQ